MNDELSTHESSSSLEEIASAIDRVPGYNYYKYRREDGSAFLTPISPKTWGPSCPHTFIRAYRETKSGLLVPIKLEPEEEVKQIDWCDTTVEPVLTAT